jgi:hypothetical protein
VYDPKYKAAYYNDAIPKDTRQSNADEIEEYKGAEGSYKPSFLYLTPAPPSRFIMSVIGIPPEMLQAVLRGLDTFRMQQVRVTVCSMGLCLVPPMT